MISHAYKECLVVKTLLLKPEGLLRKSLSLCERFSIEFSFFEGKFSTEISFIEGKFSIEISFLKESLVWNFFL